MFRRVLATVRRIPKGKVSTYGDLARASGYPGAARQVVWALRTGKDVPWHRVLGAKGRILLTGEPGFEQRMRLQARAWRLSRTRWISDASGIGFVRIKSAQAESLCHIKTWRIGSLRASSTKPRI
jgi:methylated-DNA-protein-cysteine methyltransferase-like protein